MALEMMGMASRGGPTVFEAVVLLGAIVFVVIVAAVILAYVRQRMRSSRSWEGRPGFDLAQIRRLKESGQVSPEEYDNLVETLYADCE